LTLAVSAVLRPLGRLRRDLLGRSDDDLQPVPDADSTRDDCTRTPSVPLLPISSATEPSSPSDNTPPPTDPTTDTVALPDRDTNVPITPPDDGDDTLRLDALTLPDTLSDPADTLPLNHAENDGGEDDEPLTASRSATPARECSTSSTSDTPEDCATTEYCALGPPSRLRAARLDPLTLTFDHPTLDANNDSWSADADTTRTPDPLVRPPDNTAAGAYKTPLTVACPASIDSSGSADAESTSVTRRDDTPSVTFDELPDTNSIDVVALPDPLSTRTRLDDDADRITAVCDAPSHSGTDTYRLLDRTPLDALSAATFAQLVVTFTLLASTHTASDRPGTPTDTAPSAASASDAFVAPTYSSIAVRPDPDIAMRAGPSAPG